MYIYIYINIYIPLSNFLSVSLSRLTQSHTNTHTSSRLQLNNANQRIMELEMANMKLSEERIAVDHAQTIIKNLDQVYIYMYKLLLPIYTFSLSLTHKQTNTFT